MGSTGLSKSVPIAVGGPKIPLECSSPGGEASNLTGRGSVELYPASGIRGRPSHWLWGADAAAIQTTTLLVFLPVKEKDLPAKYKKPREGY